MMTSVFQLDAHVYKSTNSFPPSPQPPLKKKTHTWNLAIQSQNFSIRECNLYILYIFHGELSKVHRVLCRYIPTPERAKSETSHKPCAVILTLGFRHLLLTSHRLSTILYGHWHMPPLSPWHIHYVPLFFLYVLLRPIPCALVWHGRLLNY